MKGSDLQPQARAAIAAGVFVVLVVIAWIWFVGPTLAERATVRADFVTAESQLEQMEREIENIPQESESERAEWQRSRDELVSKLGPESELPLLIESLIRLAEAQGVEIFLSSESTVAVTARPVNGVAPSRLQSVIVTVPGSSMVPLECRLFGDYAAISRFISQTGRLGWVTEIAALSLERSFPEVVGQVRLNVYFRPSERDPGNGAGALGASSARSAGQLGARGGRGNG